MVIDLPVRPATTGEAHVENREFEEIIEKAQQGDQEAQEKLLGPLAGHVRAFVRPRLRGSVLQSVVGSMDIVQSVLIKFMSRLRAGKIHLSQPGDAEKLARTMAWNRITDWFRHWRVRPRTASDVSIVAAAGPSPSRTVAHADLVERFRQRLAELDDQVRRIFDWKMAEDGLSWPAIAERLGLGPEAVHALEVRYYRKTGKVAAELGIEKGMIRGYESGN